MSSTATAAATAIAETPCPPGTSIERIETFVINPDWRKNLVFVRVETADGVVGWGEAYTQYDRDRAIVEQIAELSRCLKGRSVFGIKNFCQIAFDDFAQRRGSLELFAALSALEQAMWDAAGHTLGQPVYNLLGGPVRERFRVYANGWGYGLETPREHAQAAARMVAQGFDAIKMDPLPKPWRTFATREQMDVAVKILAEVRSAVGDGVEILIDNHRRLAPMHAIALAQRYEEYGIYWFEEPCQAHNLQAMAQIRRRLRTPIVTGEELYTKSAFRPVFEAEAADIINPDVSNVGGILELKEIAAMAEPFMVAVSPHNYNSTSVALAATVQAAATMPNFLITEYFVPLESISHQVAPDALVPVQGHIELPRKPGLGITVDESFIRAQTYRPPAARSFRAFHSVL
ncbi:mandelate racemase/muconate lactonizing enzyme family protein [Variovorax sp. PBL-E5]|uniref:mandelate racemase/muconate lactonizing enzyme family protein n=1 Tax=Variovorax sp. PBL-E5 TaxID=434014 RepID=UPI00131897D6|nr:mandelate racemase/muconate lactonizing enzyme family protein [Variovorax sp. PBL-E5]VTU16783.1 D-galactonate dehydratase [Variovorax sp. PBL-E5]